MAWYLLSFVIGSIIFQVIIIGHIGKHIHKPALVFCVGVTFFAMLPIELWATHKGIWSWSDHITFYKIMNIPFEELLLYCTSAVTTVVLFELLLYILKRTICKA